MTTWMSAQAQDVLASAKGFEAAEDRRDPGLAVGKAEKERDGLVRRRPEVDRQHFPQGHEPQTAAQRQCERQIDNPDDQQGRGGQAAEFNLTA